MFARLDEIAKRLDHADEVAHETARKVGEVHAELEAVKPMIERWQHSRIARLAGGHLPWQQP